MRHMVLPVLSRLRATLQLGSVPCASFTTRGGCPAGCRHRWHRAGRARREILGGLLPKTGEYPPEVFLGNKPPELTPTGVFSCLGQQTTKTGEYPPEVFLGNKPPELTPTGASGLREYLRGV